MAAEHRSAQRRNRSELAIVVGLSVAACGPRTLEIQLDELVDRGNYLVVAVEIEGAVVASAIDTRAPDAASKLPPSRSIDADTEGTISVLVYDERPAPLGLLIESSSGSPLPEPEQTWGRDLDDAGFQPIDRPPESLRERRFKGASLCSLFESSGRKTFDESVTEGLYVRALVPFDASALALVSDNEFRRLGMSPRSSPRLYSIGSGGHERIDAFVPGWAESFGDTFIIAAAPGERTLAGNRRLYIVAARYEPQQRMELWAGDLEEGFVLIHTRGAWVRWLVESGASLFALDDMGGVLRFPADVDEPTEPELLMRGVALVDCDVRAHANRYCGGIVPSPPEGATALLPDGHTILRINAMGSVTSHRLPDVPFGSTAAFIGSTGDLEAFVAPHINANTALHIITHDEIVPGTSSPQPRPLAASPQAGGFVMVGQPGFFVERRGEHLCEGAALETLHRLPSQIAAFDGGFVVADGFNAVGATASYEIISPKTTP